MSSKRSRRPSPPANGCSAIALPDSTRAYQGAAGKLDKTLIDSLERVAVGETQPDLTFVLDMSVEKSLQRAAQRRDGAVKADRFESETRAFHETLRQAFLDIAAAAPQRCIVIDAAWPSEDVAKQIWAKVRERLIAPGRQAETAS